MTPEEIDNMPAGTELDALVAENAMGWEVQTHFEDRIVWKTVGPVGSLLDDWNPSTDIYDAWQIVEKALPYHFGLTFNKREDLWVCGIQIGDGFGNAYGETAPLSICRASLKAVLSQRREDHDERRD